MTRQVSIPEFTAKYLAASSRLILLDQDGTLVPLQADYKTRISTERVKGIIDTLALDIKNQVVVISGRDRDYLDSVWGEAGFALVAEHGAFHKDPGAGWQEVLLRSRDWMEKTLPALNSLVFHYEGSQLELKFYSMAWHYRAIRDTVTLGDKKQILAAIRSLPEYGQFAINDSEYTIELRTPGIDKGSFVGRWLNGKGFDFVLAIGDSSTDEDLFDIFDKNAFTIKVGLGPTKANYFINNQQDVLPLICRMVELSGVGASPS